MKQTKNFGGRPTEREPRLGERTHLSVAIPLPLKRRIEGEARKQGRSVSAEVVYRLEQSFDRQNVIEGVIHALSAAGLTTASPDIGRPPLKVHKGKAK